MKLPFDKNYILYIAVFLLVIFIVLLIFLSNSSTTTPQKNGTLSPSLVPFPTSSTPSSQTKKPQANPPAIGTLPRQGFAINTQSPIVQASEQEVTKLRANLPYLKDFTATTRQKISIVIPDEQYQDDPWKLTAQIFGPDYQIAESEANYQREKLSFLEGANAVFSWIKENGADPNKVIIKWGDQAFVQERAEEWLDTK